MMDLPEMRVSKIVVELVPQQPEDEYDKQARERFRRLCAEYEATKENLHEESMAHRATLPAGRPNSRTITETQVSTGCGEGGRDALAKKYDKSQMDLGVSKDPELRQTEMMREAEMDGLLNNTPRPAATKSSSSTTSLAEKWRAEAEAVVTARIESAMEHQRHWIEEQMTIWKSQLADSVQERTAEVVDAGARRLESFVESEMSDLHDSIMKEVRTTSATILEAPSNTANDLHRSTQLNAESSTATTRPRAFLDMMTSFMSKDASTKEGQAAVRAQKAVSSPANKARTSSLGDAPQGKLGGEVQIGGAGTEQITDVLPSFETGLSHLSSQPSEDVPSIATPQVENHGALADDVSDHDAEETPPTLTWGTLFKNSSSTYQGSGAGRTSEGDSDAPETRSLAIPDVPEAPEAGGCGETDLEACGGAWRVESSGRGNINNMF